MSLKNTDLTSVKHGQTAKFPLSIPFYAILVIPFLLQIILAVGIINYLSFRNGQKTVDDLATQLQESVSDRLQEKLKTPLDLEGHNIVSSASIGIALSSSTYENSSEILRDADIAMYRAKAKGKARHEIFDQAMYFKPSKPLN